MTTEFTDLGLRPEIVQTVAELGYTTPTPIQARTIPALLAGHDVIGQAQTGTGKTAAFALPILNEIEVDSGKVQALILAPTRELAMQVAKATYAYGEQRGVKVLAVYGGQPYQKQIRRLRKGVDVVAGTPGRLLDLMRQGALDLTHVRHLVLDEADEMLSMGFVEDIEKILAATPAERQTLLFSATMPNPIRKLADKYMRTPEFIQIQRKQLTVSTIAQRFYFVRDADKLAALTRIFEMEDITSALIFTRTRAGSAQLANALTQQGFPAEPLNGDLSQDARIRVLNRFREGQIKVLAATDVAARGLDIDDISHVFNFDLPPDPEVFVHRIGRTGRAGRNGIAISFASPKERGRMRRIQNYTKTTIPQAELPTIEEIQERRDRKLIERMEVWLRRGRCQHERAMIDRLVEEGSDPLEVAAASLKMARASEKKRQIQRIRPLGEHELDNKKRGGSRERRNRGKQREQRGRRPASKTSRQALEKDMVRISMNVGKAHGVRPGDVVGTVAHFADIPGNNIGAIRIQDQVTLFDVKKDVVDRVLTQVQDKQIRRQKIELELA